MYPPGTALLLNGKYLCNGMNETLYEFVPIGGGLSSNETFADNLKTETKETRPANHILGNYGSLVFSVNIQIFNLSNISHQDKDECTESGQLLHSNLTESRFTSPSPEEHGLPNDTSIMTDDDNMSSNGDNDNITIAGNSSILHTSYKYLNTVWDDNKNEKFTTDANYPTYKPPEIDKCNGNESKKVSNNSIILKVTLRPSISILNLYLNGSSYYEIYFMNSTERNSPADDILQNSNDNNETRGIIQSDTTTNIIYRNDYYFNDDAIPNFTLDSGNAIETTTEKTITHRYYIRNYNEVSFKIISIRIRRGQKVPTSNRFEQ